MNALQRSIAFSLLLLVVFLPACGDDDPSGPNDTTAPIVFSISPGNDESNVSLGADIVVRFNEDMDASSATGQVTLSNGTVTALTWDDARTLRIEHSDWAQGVRIDVTLGASLRDKAGNGLGVAFTFGFWTTTPQVILLSTDPADGATGVKRNTTVSMRFSRRMNLTSLAAATSVDDGSVSRAPVQSSLEHGSDDVVVMRFDAALPASATIIVAIAASATAESGGNLAAAAQYSFTTGTTLDTTPPTLVSIVPANGSTISANTPSIVMTFSEAIDPSRFDPIRLGAQFFLQLSLADIEPTWSEGGTVLTVPLPSPLPAGLPIVVDFDVFYDLVGNASTTGLEYAVTVAGTADPWPFVDGLTFRYFGTAGETGQMPFQYYDWRRWEQQSSNVFRYVRYFDDSLAADDGWEVFQRSSSEIRFLGFGERDEGSVFDVIFTPSVLYMKLPVQVQTWDGTTQAALEEGTIRIDYEIEVVGREDLPAWFGELGMGHPLLGRDVFPRIHWIDCWKTVLRFEMISDQQLIQSGEEIRWFAPTVGIVRKTSTEIDLMQERTRESEEDLIGLDFPD
jgi:methionine-rich copper-binding protein CopC